MVKKPPRSICTGNTTAIVGEEKYHGLRDFIGSAEPAKRTLLAIDVRRSAPDGEEASRSFKPGVSVEPGLTAFTRIRRVLRSAGCCFDPTAPANLALTVIPAFDPTRDRIYEREVFEEMRHDYAAGDRIAAPPTIS
jgi:hypothetical protein